MNTHLVFTSHFTSVTNGYFSLGPGVPTEKMNTAAKSQNKAHMHNIRLEMAGKMKICKFAYIYYAVVLKTAIPNLIAL